MATKVYTFVPEKGFVRITGDLNTRKGAPTRAVDVVKTLHAGVVQPFVGYVLDGESVAQNQKWFMTGEGDFFWSGNVDTQNVPLSGKTFSKPLDDLVCTQKFGERADFYKALGSERGHNGMDFRTRTPAQPSEWKKPVYSVLDGRVSEASENEWNGKYIRIVHPNNYESVYLHLSSIDVAQGQTVTAGMKIGVSGNSGSASEAPHLHFGYRPVSFDKGNGYMGYVDPAPYFKDEIRYVA